MRAARAASHKTHTRALSSLKNGTVGWCTEVSIPRTAYHHVLASNPLIRPVLQ